MFLLNSCTNSKLIENENEAEYSYVQGTKTNTHPWEQAPAKVQSLGVMCSCQLVGVNPLVFHQCKKEYLEAVLLPQLCLLWVN